MPTRTIPHRPLLPAIVLLVLCLPAAWAQPSITSLSPSSATAGGPDFTLTVNGTGFVTGAVVNWNAAPLTTVFVSATQLTATVPAANIAAPGSASITVVNPGPVTSAAVTFNITSPTPVISGLIPASATAGGSAFTLTINGTGFLASSVVNWNAAPLTTTYISATQLTAQVPAASIAIPGSASITVVNPGPVTSAAVTFNIISPTPVITTLSPSFTTAGAPTFTLTVNGTGFLDVSVVNWNAASLTTIFVSATQLTALVPAANVASPGSASITVTNPGPVISTPATFTIDPPPVITSLNPSSATAGGPTFTLTVNGTAFIPGTVVQWDATPLTTTFVGPTQLTAQVPAANISTPGTAWITARTPTLVTSAPVSLIITSPTPVISGLIPASATPGGPAFTLTVNGTGFLASSVVNWNAAPLTTTFVSATQLTAQVPAASIATPGSASVTVVNPGPVTSAAVTFNIASPTPVISGLIPASATAGGPAFTLTVNGTGFLASSVVNWDTAPLTTTFVSATQLTAQVPAGSIVAPGSASITVTNPGPVTSVPVSFTISPPPPVITSLSPSAVVAGGLEFTMTVTGTGFQAASLVNWNASPLATVFDSATQLRATVPAGNLATPGSATITVANPGPVISNSLALTIIAQLAIATTTLPQGAVGAPYPPGTALQASGGTAPHTWSISAGALPPGLALDPASGVISGTPTAQGNYAFTVQVIDGGTPPLQQTVSKPLAINIVSGLTVATSSLPGSTVGAAYSQTLAAAGGIAPYTWALAAGSQPLPPGLNLATGGQITGSPTSAGTFTFTVQVTDSTAATATRQLSIQVAPAPSITTVSLPNATVNVAYSQLLAVTGGTQPYAWAVTSGALPGGLTLTAQTGVISGIPVAAGPFSFTVRVSDSVGATATKALAITVGGALTIVTASLPSGVAGVSYSQMLTATGGTPPYSNWLVISGALPAGLSLSAATGSISGAPLSAGASSFVVQVSDSAAAIATKALAINVTTGLSVTTASLPGGVVGTSYSQTLTASGGTPPYSWVLTSGSLPPGLNLTTGGQITGTPTSADSYSFAVQVTDSAAVTAVKALSITVTAGLSITTTSLPGGVVGTSYSQTLTATGGTSPYSWAVASGSLPPGLNLTTGGQITGTPTSPGTFSFAVRVTDSAAASATKTITLGVLGITSPAQLPAGAVGTAYSQTLAATGGTPPYTWAVTSGQLPAGLALNAPTGVLAGTPTAAGTFSFRVQVTDTAGKQAAQDFSLTIVTGFVITTASPLPAATVGVSYSQILAAAGGAEPYSDWRVTAGILPAGLSLDSASGRLSGTPTLAATLAFTVQVRDSSGRTASKEFTLSVQAAALVITTASPLPSGVVGRAYSQALQSTGGLAPLTWVLKEGSLPAGLSLDASGGRISGTPTAVATASFTLEVTDSARKSASKAFTLAIDPPSLPAIQFVGAPDTAEPAQQPAVRLTLASGYPLPITGQMTLIFEPDAIHPADDPAVQFSTGGRTVSFSIAANATQATFATASLAFQTGTVAGTITLRATFQTAGRDITPSPAPVKVVRLLRSAPVIRSVQVERTGSGFDVVVKGLSTPRQVTQAAFRFNPASGANLQTTEITLPMTTLSDLWYQDQESRQYGSQFTLRQSFTVSGDVRAVSSVSVTLTNTVGSSQAASAGL